MSWDGSIFKESVPGAMCLGSFLECQLERVGETLGLLSSINATEGR